MPTVKKKAVSRRRAAKPAAPAKKKPGAKKSAAQRPAAKRAVVKRAAPKRAAEKKAAAPRRAASVETAGALERAAEGLANEAFAQTLEKLRGVLQPYTRQLKVVGDGRVGFALACHKPFDGKQLYFGGVRAGKSYISFHLFPLYIFPELLEGIPPALDRRRQGKTCFNFKSPDDPGLRHIVDLTRRGFERFKAAGLI